MLSIGIDPGASGSIAAITEAGTVQTIAWRETWHDIVEWIRDICDMHQCHAILEQVNAMPKQGVTSTFKFGRMFGAAEMLLVSCEIPYETMRPAQWQKQMRCLTKGDKNVSKAAAQRLFPGVKVTHANADAILLAELCRRTRVN